MLPKPTRLCWWIAAAALGALVWLCVGLGISQAAGQSLAAPQPFLANYGLTPAPAAFTLADPQVLAEMAGQDYQTASVDGLAERGTVAISNDISGLRLGMATLHEWLHQVSMPLWDGLTCEEIEDPCSQSFGVRHEEGLVQAVTIGLLPNYWRWLTGKRISTSRVLEESDFYYPEATRLWRRAAVSATGRPIRSRAANEWLRAALTTPPLERVALVAG